MIPDINIKEFFLWLMGKRQRFRVTGNSMLPLLKPQEEVLIDPEINDKKLPKVGEIVVAQHPTRKELQLIKRITFITAEGHYFLQGDNLQESTDSRVFGTVNLEQIVGRVTCRFG